MKEIEIASEALCDMLCNIQLGSVVNECMLSINGGHGSIGAIDITNSLIALSEAKLTDNKEISEDFGLGNLELLIRFVSSLSQEKVTLKYTNDSITISSKERKLQLKYLLTEPGMIATRLEFEDNNNNGNNKTINKLKDLTTHEVELTYQVIKDLTNYMNLMKQKDTTVAYDDDTQHIIFTIGGPDDHKIIVEQNVAVDCVLDDDPEKSFSLRVNGEHLIKILGQIKYDDDDPPIISLGPQAIVLIENAQSTWALYPSASEEEEEEEDRSSNDD